MDILKRRYDEMVRAELTLHMIRDFIIVAREEAMEDYSILQHIEWLIEVNDEKKKRIF